MVSKNFWQSKTFWMGVIQILIAVLGLVAEFLKVGDFTSSAIALLISGVLTIILRFVTTMPITQAMPKPVVEAEVVQEAK